MAAFDRARVDGADGIELDVQLDRDGTVVVFHDDTLDRLVGRPGRLSELSALERNFSSTRAMITSDPSERFRSVGVPSLIR